MDAKLWARDASGEENGRARQHGRQWRSEECGGEDGGTRTDLRGRGWVRRGESVAISGIAENVQRMMAVNVNLRDIEVGEGRGG